jgi:hypothetical protein
MNARFQPFLRPIAMLDAARIDAIITTPRTKYVLAQVVMVAGYVALIVNPFDGDAMLLGLLCQAVALMLYVSSKQPLKTSR